MIGRETLGILGLFWGVFGSSEVKTVKDPCILPHDQGPCQSYVLQWHWDPKHETCRQFYFGGCLGNRNRFSTKTHCLKTCVYRLKSEQTPDVCFQVRDPGHCDDERDHPVGTWYWTFSAEKGQCEKFFYYGCGGNHNRFLNEFKCQKVCGERLSPRVEACSKCDERTSMCKENAKYNYTCECRDGFIKNRYGKCVDLDECRTYKPECDKSGCEITLANCHRHANCLNTMGSYRCQCMTEYRGDGKTCSYVGLGRSTTNCGDCDEMATCEKGVCRCNLGYRGDGFNCKDVNECKISPYPCHEKAECENTVGSFICECREGYAGNGFNCTSATRSCLDKFDRNYKEQCTGGEGSWGERYWFNHETQECELFWYDGCRGRSRNIFTHLKTCQLMCEKTNVLSRAATCWDDFDEHYRDECSNGQWRHNYYFDHRTRTCTQFWYDGCEGKSRNIFQDLIDCQYMCEKQPMYKSRACLEEFDIHLKDQCAGKNKWASRYYYDEKSEKCFAFWWDGCEGKTQNFFRDEATCVALCEKPAADARERLRMNIAQFVESPCSPPCCTCIEEWDPIGSVGVAMIEEHSNDSDWNVVPGSEKHRKMGKNGRNMDKEDKMMESMKKRYLREKFNYTDENNETSLMDDKACTPNPCKNKGMCKGEGNGKYHCSCSPGYKGKRCEKAPSDPCETLPCKNGGTCKLNVGKTGYVCKCPPKVVGVHCDFGVSGTTPQPLNDSKGSKPKPLIRKRNRPETKPKKEAEPAVSKPKVVKAGTGGKLVQKKPASGAQTFSDVKFVVVQMLMFILVLLVL